MSILPSMTVGLLLGWGARWLWGQWRDRTQVEAVESDVETAVISVTTPGADDSQTIKGIGPTYARRLYEAGVRTFADLAGPHAGARVGNRQAPQPTTHPARKLDRGSKRAVKQPLT